MELSNYVAVRTATTVVVDRSMDGDFLRIEFNMSFPALSCEFASVDVSDVLGTNRLNITKTVRKFTIDRNLKPTGFEFHSGPIPAILNHGDDIEEDLGEGALSVNSLTFDKLVHQYPILVINFFAPWCYWSNRLKPSWEKASKIMKEKYDPEADGRILLAKVDCTMEMDLCRRHHIQGYPSIRIFRKGNDVKEDNGHHEHESYYGDRDTDSLVQAMEALVSPIPKESHKVALVDKNNGTINAVKRPAPSAAGCRIEGFVRVKKVPGNLVISAHSGAHSFDASVMNMSHVVNNFSFGKRLSVRMLNEVKRLTPYLGASTDRLTGTAYITKQGDENANVTIEHYLQIVKAEVVSRKASQEFKLLEEYEYTSHSSLVHSHDVPVAKFHFELSPMQVLVTEVSKSFSHFITNVCAIIGGVFYGCWNIGFHTSQHIAIDEESRIRETHMIANCVAPRGTNFAQLHHMGL